MHHLWNGLEMQPWLYDAKAARGATGTHYVHVHTCVSTGGGGGEISQRGTYRHAKRANKEIRHPGEI